MAIEKLQVPYQTGTLAIDLGNSTTVVAFQGEKEQTPNLLDLGNINRSKGEIPTLIWQIPEENKLIIGQEVINLGLSNKESPHLNRDFKRLIGNKDFSELSISTLSPEQAGELFIQEIWKRIPKNLSIQRLVLTAPVETYRAYRSWLQKVCETFPIEEIALVDEPTAAAMGAGLPAGSKLLVIDIGGSTIDFSLVALEGGEGKAAPIAQLMRFGGKDLNETSKQVLRCAKVLGKAGFRLGGRDFDRWIASYLCPGTPLTESILNAAERLKCRLSDSRIEKKDTLLEISNESSSSPAKNLILSRIELENLLLNRGLLNSLNILLEKTLAKGRANGCELNNLNGVVIVGGGSRIPLLRRWVEEKTKPAPLLTPPPIEAIAIGALNLTPGVTIKDILQRGVSLRCWDQRTKQHIWHPIFLAGQPWPTSNDLEVVLAGSKVNQKEIEIVLGEPDLEEAHEVIYINGIPTLKNERTSQKVIPWENSTNSLILNPEGQPGEDCLRLQFKINSDAQLEMKGIDIRNGQEINTKILGPVR